MNWFGSGSGAGSAGAGGGTDGASPSCRSTCSELCRRERLRRRWACSSCSRGFTTGLSRWRRCCSSVRVAPIPCRLPWRCWSVCRLPRASVPINGFMPELLWPMRRFRPMTTGGYRSCAPGSKLWRRWRPRMSLAGVSGGCGTGRVCSNSASRHAAVCSNAPWRAPLQIRLASLQLVTPACGR